MKPRYCYRRYRREVLFIGVHKGALDYLRPGELFTCRNGETVIASRCGIFVLRPLPEARRDT